MDSLVRDKLTLVAALGTGVVVGVSGIYLYWRLNKSVARELSQLSGTISDLRKEIEELKVAESQYHAHKKSHKKRSARIAAVTADETRSIPNNIRVTNAITDEASGDQDDEDDEFYDFPDTDDETATWIPSGMVAPKGDISSSPSGDDYFRQLDQQLDDPKTDMEQLYFDMKLKKQDYAKNAGFLWRLAKATHLLTIVAAKNGDSTRRRELAFEAYSLGRDALEYGEEDPECHKWYAITLGSLSEFIGTQQKIENGYEFKKHVDHAVALKPNDPTLHHMLGRWCFEVSQLTWIERKLASTLYSAPPAATLQEARSHLFEADKLRNDWKENILFIAKTYAGEGNYQAAISWLDRGAALVVKGESDQMVHREILLLQKQYASYRSS